MTFGKDDARCPVFGALSKDAAIYGMSLVNAAPAIQEMSAALTESLLGGS
jgi:hypothetical protein